MKLRTELSPLAPSFRLTVPFPGIFMGSCFAERLGNRYADAAFPALVQPTGTIYHPEPLLWQLKWLSGSVEVASETFVTVRGEQRNLMFHSKFGSEGENGIPNVAVREDFQRWLSQPNAVLVLTFGTATGYRHQDSGFLVANCHTLPGNAFNRELQTCSEMYPAWVKWLEDTISIQPGLRVILSVSPVRHLRNGLEKNMLSKAHLRLLCQQLKDAFPEHVTYFPAFELMLDDLRDYRFYGDDLVHPSELATRYITDLFTTQYLGQEGTEWVNAWDAIAKFARHRPRFGNPEARLSEALRMAEPYANRTDIQRGLFRLGIYPNTHKIEPTITPPENQNR